MSRFGNTEAQRSWGAAKQEAYMVIQSRTIVGACAALAIVGGALAGSVALMPSDSAKQGQVEIKQVEERSWAVEVKDLSSDVQQTAALTR
jgi:hypothetical protein